jgi:hypothetical protein
MQHKITATEVLQNVTEFKYAYMPITPTNRSYIQDGVNNEIHLGNVRKEDTVFIVLLYVPISDA